MLMNKEDAFYKRYYLGNKCIWKRQKTAKEMVMYIMEQMEGNCANMQSIIRQNTKKILKYVDAHYQAKKVVAKKVVAKKGKK